MLIAILTLSLISMRKRIVPKVRKMFSKIERVEDLEWNLILCSGSWLAILVPVFNSPMIAMQLWWAAGMIGLPILLVYLVKTIHIIPPGRRV